MILSPVLLSVLAMLFFYIWLQSKLNKDFDIWLNKRFNENKWVLFSLNTHLEDRNSKYLHLIALTSDLYKELKAIKTSNENKNEEIIDYANKRQTTPDPESWNKKTTFYSYIVVDIPKIWINWVRAWEADFEKYWWQLDNWIWHLKNSAFPWELWFWYLFDHSSRFTNPEQISNYAYYFSNLDKLKVWDSVFLSNTERKKKYEYKVTKKFIVEKTDLSWFKSEPWKKKFALQTCYPRWINDKRLIVVLQLK